MHEPNLRAARDTTTPVRLLRTGFLRNGPKPHPQNQGRLWRPPITPFWLPGLPGPVPGPSLMGGFPGGWGSIPLPTPLFPFARKLLLPDAAIASEVNDVDNSIVMEGGVTTANFPHVARNLRRS